MNIKIPKNTTKPLSFNSEDEINNFIIGLETNTYDMKTINVKPLGGFKGITEKMIYSFKDNGNDKVVIFAPRGAVVKEIYYHLYAYMKITDKKIIPAIYSVYSDDADGKIVMIEDNLFSKESTEMQRYFDHAKECIAWGKNVNKKIRKCFAADDLMESHEYKLWLNMFNYMRKGQIYIIDKTVKSRDKEKEEDPGPYSGITDNYIDGLVKFKQEFLVTNAFDNLVHIYFPYNNTIHYTLSLFYAPPSPFIKLLKNFFITTFQLNINFIFHNDLHPKNVFINVKTKKIRIIDFGKATVFNNGGQYVELRKNWNNQDARNTLLTEFFDREFESFLLRTWGNISFLPNCINPGLMKMIDPSTHILAQDINRYLAEYYFDIIGRDIYKFFKQRYIDIISENYPKFETLPIKTN